jgi:hypothetical protein
MSVTARTIRSEHGMKESNWGRRWVRLPPARRSRPSRPWR